jgi:amino acid adenylation domain-containing protein
MDKKNIQDILALTPMQEGMLYHYLKDPGNDYYFEQLGLVISGDIDKELFKRAWNAVVETNGMLRTLFRWEEVKKPLQVVLRHHPPGIEFLEYPEGQSVGPGNEEAEGRNRWLEGIKQADRNKKFDLHRIPFRITLCKLEHTKYVMILSNHHILYDGWSNGIILKEFFEAYNNLYKGNKALSIPVKSPFKEFVRLHQIHNKDKEKQYWTNYLAGMNTKIELPVTVKKGKGGDIQCGENFQVRLSRDMTRKLEEFVKKRKITLASLFNTGWGILLQKYNSTDDVVFGTTISGRSAKIHGIENIVGLFINTLPQRIRTLHGEKIEKFLARTNKELQTIEKYETTSLVDIKNYCQPDGDETLFNSIVVVGNYPLENAASEDSLLSIDSYSIFERTNYDLTFCITPADEIQLDLIYRVDLFEKETAARLFNHLSSILQQIIHAPRRTTGEIDILSEEEKRQLLYDFRGGETPYPKKKLLHQWYEEQVDRTPDNPAVVFENNHLTYRELELRSNALGHLLKDRGVTANTIVGLIGEFSLEMNIGIMGIFKAGGAYLAIRADYPKERIEYMLQDSRTGILVSQLNPDVEPYTFLFDGEIVNISDQKFYPRAKGERLEYSVRSDNLAYLLYTSGSTGKPKGVLVEHQSVINMVNWFGKTYDLRQGIYAIQLSEYTFDPTVEEIFATLFHGGTLHVVHRDLLTNFQRLRKYIDRAQIHIVNCVPTFLKELLVDSPKLKSIRLVISGGDRLDDATKDRLLDKGYVVCNHYGLIETTLDVLTARCLKEKGASLLRPMANAKAYILDKDHRLMPIGVVGEICIAGDAVVRGYSNNPRLNAQRFLKNLFFEGETVLRTGDLGRILPDGSIEILGRKDDQVKVRGFRIELGEIESQLLNHPHIKDVAVITRGNEEERQVYAYYVDNTRVQPELFPSVGEYPLYDDFLYYAMTNDTLRADSYRLAINRLVTDKTVVEIGTGQDIILSRFCLEAGAKKVYAIEMDDGSYHIARETIKKLGIEEKITLIHGDATMVELPEKVDVCLSEIIGTIGGAEGAAAILNRCRRFLKKDGTMIPQKCLTKIAAVSLPTILQNRPGFSEVGAGYIKKLFDYFNYKFDFRIGVKRFPKSNIISNWDIFEHLDFSGIAKEEDTRHIHLKINRDTVFDGFLLWINLHTVPDDVIDTLEREYNWMPVFVPLPVPGTAVSRGDVIDARCMITLSDNKINPDYKIKGVLNKKGADSEDIEFECDLPYRGTSFLADPFHKKIIDESAGNFARYINRETGAVELRAYLESKLPDYMIPSYFVPIDKIPLTPNGKVNRKALPAPKPGSGGVYAAPADKIEKKLVETWAQVLGLDKDQISVTANFFDLGGHSLRATEVVYRVRKELEVDIRLKDFIKQPLIRPWAQTIRQLQPAKYIEVRPVEQREYYDLSSAQRRLWIICQFEEDATSYNMVGTFTVTGDFSPRAFEQAVQTLVDRHDNFRTVFIYVDGEAKQKIRSHFRFTLEQVDMRGTGPIEREQQIREIIKIAANTAFNLETGPLFLFKLLRLDQNRYILIANIHHIINDGWSLGVINNEIITLYNTYLNDEKNPLPCLNLQYRDYTMWHNALSREGHLDRYGEYWLEKFKDKPGGIELPLDHPRPPIQTFNGGRVYFTIDKQNTLRLNHIYPREEATIFMKLLALLGIFLYRYTGQEDITIGAPISGRSKPELYHMIGFLVNTLVYRMQVNPAETFPQLLGNVKQETLACYENQDYPFDALVERLELDRDLSRSPLFNVMLAFDNTDIDDLDLRMPGIDFVSNDRVHEFNPSVFDLVFIMDEHGHQVNSEIMYNSDLFDRSTIERMAENFKTLVADVLECKDVPISQLHCIHEQEYQTIVYTVNQTQSDFPQITLQEMFENQVEKTPGKIAVVDVDNKRTITYEDLNRSVNQLAHYLREEYQVKPGEIIGISMDRSLEMIVALLGIVKAGAGYVAIDANYPEERALHMLTDSQCQLVIIDQMRPELFGNYNGQLIHIHRHWEQISGKSPGNPIIVNKPSDIIYVIYTSGSTGIPNGAMLSQALLSNLVQWQHNCTSIDSPGRCLQFTTISFCVSFQEIFTTLTAGGELHLIDDIERRDINYLMNFLSERGIEILYLPFSYLNHLFNESSRWGEDFKHSLKHIITAGEQLKITSGLKEFLDRHPRLHLHNHYGSSEMHVVTSYTLDGAAAAKYPVPPAGKPIANTRIFILDDHRNPVPIGVWGELCIAGSAEIAGYINNETLTGKKLLNHPTLSDPGNRLYISGDIGRWLPDGNIELRGRKDTQIKIRGFRVELSEIESKLLAINRVKDCVVEVKEKTSPGADSTSSEQKYLVAYVVLDNIDIKEIKQIISNYLPHYMIPQFMVLDALPLMPNGKVDRENLPEPAPEAETRHHIDVGKINALLKEGKYKNANLQTISLQTAGKTDLEKVLTCFTHLHADRQGIEGPRVSGIDMDMFGEEDRKNLLTQLNGSTRCPLEKTLHQLFEDQVAKTPDSTALEGTSGLAPLPEPEPVSVTYNRLNRESNQLAHLLRSKGVKTNRVAGMLLEPSIGMVTSILGILKAGGAWLSIEPANSTAAVLEILEQNNVSVLLTHVETLKANHHVFSRLQDLESHQVELIRTSPRPQVLDFDSLPLPDRSYIQHQRYGKHIGLAMVKHTLTLQGTRGCPYNCAFCHKIWPKRHVFRSAENIYKEVEIYYNMGFRRFVFVDDIFNLNVQNSRRFFQLIIENRLDVQLMFPAGLRGDTLTKDYIDLMVQAGTINVALALETASPRLQKLIRKNLNLQQFREIVKYFCETYPQVVLELFTMHGFPGETEEEALMTLDFVMNMKWIHFPYINILRIYANTDMEELALEHGISHEAIDRSAALAYHELPETLPFDKGFTFEYQTRFLNEYFLDKERLLHVLPHQMKVFTEDEIVQKYNSFLPTEITDFDGLLEFTGIKREELTADTCLEEESMKPVQVDRKIREHFAAGEPGKDAIRVLLLDLSQRFVREKSMLYDGVETPLGLMYVLTYLKQQLGPKVIGAAAKSRTDFAGYNQLKKLLDDFKPGLIGIRTLTYFADFFHEAVAMMRQWGVKAPIIAGGPYATSDYSTILKDPNVNLVVMSEGEITFCELVEKIIQNQGKLPGENVLKEIPGLVFRRESNNAADKKLREILLLDGLADTLSGCTVENPDHINRPVDLANVFRTLAPEKDREPETVTVTHLNANLFLSNLAHRFSPPAVPGLPGTGPVVSYAFDASLQQVMGVLLQGGTCRIVPEEMRVPDIALLEFHQPLHIRLLQKSSPGAVKDIDKPRDRFEEKLAEIWARVLEMEKSFINRDDNFFELGGHSLKATTLISQIHKAFEAKIKIIDVFRFPTIQELAQLIREETKEEFTAIKIAEKKKYYELSSAQKRLYIVQQMDENSTVYNMPALFHLEGEPDKEKLDRVFRQLIQRHKSLRTSFQLVGEEAMQKIHDKVEFGINYYNLATEDTGGFIKSFIRPFDLSQAPLLRVGIVEFREHQHILMVDMHHIIGDGTSTSILVEEFKALYTGKELPVLALQYKDYSQWQKGEENRKALKQQEAYWLSRFEGEIPVPDLPIDYPRPTVQRFEGSSLGFEIKTGETSALKKLALDRGGTLYMVLLAIYNIFLSKLSRQECIIVGAPVAGRRHAQLQGIIGMFINTLALTNYPLPGKSFQTFLDELKQTTLEAFENQDYPYEELIDRLSGKITRDTARNPLFDVTFLLQSVGVDMARVQIPGLDIRPYEFPTYTAKFDLSLEVIETNETLSFTFEYSTALFKEKTIQRFAACFKQIINHVLENANVKLSGIEIISQQERQQVLYEFNNTKSGYPVNKTLHQLFAEQVCRTPGNIAAAALPGQIPNPKSQIPNHAARGPYKEESFGQVLNAFGEMHLSYRELNKRSGQLAHLLKEKGVKPDNIVGIMVERSLELIVGIMATLKADGVYMPIDPDYPQERINYMLADSNARFLLAAPGTQVKVNAEAKERFIEKIDISNLSSFSTSTSTCQVNPTNLAYVIYTSGTTGRPKGVLIRHRGVVNMVWLHREVFRENSRSRISQVSNFSFDAMGFEVWPCLLAGACLCIVDNETRMDPGKIKEWLIRNQVTISFQSTSMATALLDERWPGAGETGIALEVIRTAGDRLMRYPTRRYPFRFYNLYGPTEDTVWTTWAEVPVIKEPVERVNPPPIGKPAANHRVFILSQNSKLQPIGVTGELCISGVGLARGYLNRPELTAEKFIEIEVMAKVEGEEVPREDEHMPPMSHMSYIYKTGDLARWLADGNIEFLGRIDQQVKIRGFRIEPGEIEKLLLEPESVKEALVIAWEYGNGEKYLCAYVVPHSPHSSHSLNALKEHLSGRLPGYMVPSHFISLERMPLNPNGKVDLKALPEPGLISGEKYVAPHSNVEKALADNWARVLGINKERIGIDDNFFELGGHSLKATLFIARLRHQLQIRIPLIEVFKTPTIRGMAHYINQRAEHDPKPIELVEIQPVPTREYYEVSSAQKRLYIVQQMNPDNTAYNMPAAVRLVGRPDKEALENTSRQLIQRHESLRTSFEMIDGLPVQKIHDEVEFEMEYFDSHIDQVEVKIENGDDEGTWGLAPLPGESHHPFVRPFDLSKAPLLRMGLIKIREAEYILMIDMHHIISDGTSLEIFVSEFAALYRGDKLPGLRIRYKDFSFWQNQWKQSEERKMQEAYWLRQLEGELPVLKLPTDYKRPWERSFKGHAIEFDIDKEKAVKLYDLALDEGATVFMVLTALVNVLLSKLSNQEDIIIGTAVSGRSHPDLQSIMGMFVNMIALRNNPSAEKTFREFLKEVKIRSMEAFNNQDYPFDDLVEKLAVTRDAHRNPLFDVIFAMQYKNILSGAVPEVKTPGLTLKPYQKESKITKFDFQLYAFETSENLSINLEYSTDLFKETTIRQIIKYFLNILDGVIQNPDVKISDIEIMSEQEKKKLIKQMREKKSKSRKVKPVTKDFGANNKVKTRHTEFDF